MVCELHECCLFFEDNMADFPNAADYIKKKLCFGEYQKCTRYKIYKESEGAASPFFYSPRDEEEVAKITSCMRKKGGTGNDR